MALFRLSSRALRDADRSVGKAALALERAEAKYTEAGASAAAVREQIESARLAALAAAVSGNEVPDYTALQLALEHAVSRERAYAIAMQRAREALTAARQSQLAMRISRARWLLADKIVEIRRLLDDLRRLGKEIAQLGGSAELCSGPLSGGHVAHLERAAGGFVAPPKSTARCEAAAQAGADSTSLR